jgi:hypothetical protein
MAEKHIGEPGTTVLGYVQDYVENRADTILRGLGTIGQQYMRSAFGNNRSQITIVTSDFESYTAYADLRQFTVRKKDMVAARLRAVRIMGIRGMNAIFLCDQILLVSGLPAL